MNYGLKAVLAAILCWLCAPVPAGAQKAEPLTVYTIRGPSGAGMARLFEKPPQARGFTIHLEVLPQADIMVSKIASGEVTMGVLPVTTAAKLAASGKKIQIAAIIGEGMLSLLTADSSVNRIEDLKGKEIVCVGQAATPEFVLRRILKAKGMDAPSAVKLNFSYAYPEIAALLIAGRIETALLPEPFATMAREGKTSLRDAAFIQKEWAALEGSNYPMTAFVVDADFAAAHPQALAAVLAGVKDSQEWVVSKPREAARLAEKHNLGIRAATLERAIPVSAYVFIPAREARPALERLYKTFLEFTPQSIGGKMPSDNFYYY